jgi:hypothetical protein
MTAKQTQDRTRTVAETSYRRGCHQGAALLPSLAKDHPEIPAADLLAVAVEVVSRMHRDRQPYPAYMDVARERIAVRLKRGIVPTLY